jgi:hypothetical protein
MLAVAPIAKFVIVPPGLLNTVSPAMSQLSTVIDCVGSTDPPIAMDMLASTTESVTAAAGFPVAVNCAAVGSAEVTTVVDADPLIEVGKANGLTSVITTTAYKLET